LGPRHYTPQQACKRSPPKSAPTRHTCARPARPDAPRARAKRLRERKSTTSIRAQRASSTAPQASPRATEPPAAPIERSPQAAVPAGSAHARGLDRAIVACHRRPPRAPMVGRWRDGNGQRRPRARQARGGGIAWRVAWEALCAVAQSQGLGGARTINTWMSLGGDVDGAKRLRELAIDASISSSHASCADLQKVRPAGGAREGVNNALPARGLWGRRAPGALRALPACRAWAASRPRATRDSSLASASTRANRETAARDRRGARGEWRGKLCAPWCSLRG